jgi:hypothetical protein
LNRASRQVADHARVARARGDRVRPSGGIRLDRPVGRAGPCFPDLAGTGIITRHSGPAGDPARHSRRHRGSVNRRQYGLAGLMACAACGRRLTGHVGRYRHVDACEPFKAAAPRRHRRCAKTNLDHRVKGESHKVEAYEEAIGLAFNHVAVSPPLEDCTVAAATRPEPDSSDVLARARINRERDQAALRAEAAVVRPSRIPTAAEARAYLESLPELWAKTSDAGRHAIAEAVFERIDVLERPHTIRGPSHAP